MGRLEESFDNAASALTFAPIYKGSTSTILSDVVAAQFSKA